MKCIENQLFVAKYWITAYSDTYYTLSERNWECPLIGIWALRVCPKPELFFMHKNYLDLNRVWLVKIELNMSPTVIDQRQFTQGEDCVAKIEIAKNCRDITNQIN